MNQKVTKYKYLFVFFIVVSGVDLAVIKQCYFGLLTLVLEAAKYNADKSNIR